MKNSSHSDRRVASTMSQRLIDSVIKNSVPDLAAKMRKMNQHMRAQRLREAANTLSGSAANQDRPRIAACKLLVALIPDSIPVVTRLLHRFQKRRDFEIHFSLCCYLDEVADIPEAQSFATQVPDLLKKYLFMVPSNTASAAWMAAHLLGDHWEVSKSLPVLLEVAKSASHRIARVVAAKGLSSAQERLPAKKRALVRRTLETLAKSDRSAAVRIAARMALKQEIQG